MRRLIHIAILGLLSTSVLGQDGHFTNFSNAYTYYNPATAGILKQGDYRISNAHRRQWKKVVAPAREMNLSFDMPFMRYEGMDERKSFFGAGFNMYSERWGTSRSGVFRTDLQLMGAVRSERSVFSLGLSGGRARQRLDLQALTWDSQFNGFKFDGGLPTYESTGGGAMKSSYWDVGAGLNWFYQGYGNGYMILGGSYKHALNPQVAFESYEGSPQAATIIGHFEAEIPMNFRGMKKMGLVPMALFSMQGPHMEILAGGTYKLYLREHSRYTKYLGDIAISAGAVYRYGDAVAILVNYHHHNYNVGFSYDITTSKLSQGVGVRGGPELSFTYYGLLKYFYTGRGR